MQTFKMRNAERIAGLFVIAVFVSCVFIIMFMARQQEWFAPGYSIRAVFAHGNDLVPNTAVFIEGIDVGKVRKIGFDEQNRIEVTLWIKERFMQQIRKDSYAAIKRPNLFGNPILEITLGSPREPIIPEGG
ncbi:MAG TPA: MlaD family protein, partial [bacterium]|nr:MlaD family protein [bacterium]